MSSVAVRTLFKSTLTSEASSEKISDLSGGFLDIQDHLAADSITMQDPWVGLQFIPNDEVPVTVKSNNDEGFYRENGAVYIHVVDVAKPGARDTILTRAETLRDIFRGRRISDVLLIRSVTPPNFEFGATIEFEGGFISASFIVEYQYDKIL